MTTTLESFIILGTERLTLTCDISFDIRRGELEDVELSNIQSYGEGEDFNMSFDSFSEFCKIVGAKHGVRIMGEAEEQCWKSEGDQDAFQRESIADMATGR